MLYGYKSPILVSYICGAKMYGEWRCKTEYEYCIICKEFIGNDYVIHRQETHSKDLSCEFDRVVVNCPDDVIRYFCDLIVSTLYNENPRLYLLKLNDNVNINIQEKYQINLDKTKILNEIRCRLFHNSNNYSCILCGMNYEAFPTQKMVTKHIKLCVALRG